MLCILINYMIKLMRWQRHGDLKPHLSARNMIKLGNVLIISLRVTQMYLSIFLESILIFVQLHSKRQ